ncbi:MAG: hypothetical protein GWP18_03120, partial [Proteobacteria bacterium]|nr:hypothetical protein [Pseudomonadota bacterium]
MTYGTPTSRRWWQYKRTWFIGIPALLVLGTVGLYAWGTAQPKPTGFAPTASVAAGPSDVASGPGVETSSDEELQPAEATDSQDDPTSVELADTAATPIRFTVDARSKEDWVLFDFNAGGIVPGDFTEPGWDIALQRTGLLTNSGVTNPSGPGGAFDLGEVPLTDAA